MNMPKTVSEAFLNQSTYYTETMSETFITWETFLQHINITNFLFLLLLAIFLVLVLKAIWGKMQKAGLI